ncbi:response regulator, partial [candidate division GN15 bacterium]|nr:response regulator [candidate division GN15 bacterium]
AGGIAHDFNNLLGAILGNVTLAMSSLDTSSELWGLLNEVERASDRARKLTHQLLTFSRGGEPVKRRLDFGLLVRDSADFVLHGSAVKCELDTAADLPPVMADGGQLDQAVSNLIINARQAMGDRGVLRVRVSTVTPGEAEGLPQADSGWVVATIEDEGKGIPEEVLDRIFDPFFTTKADGNGLGLAVSHSVIRAHGGHIKVTSSINQGTTFMVYLPIAKGQTERQQLPCKEITTGEGRVLVVDDDSLMRSMYVEMLAELGYEPDLAATGQEGLRRLQTNIAAGKRYRAVILDLTLRGELRGTDVLKSMRETDPHVPAIVASGYATDPVLSEYQAHGFAGRLAKPFTLSELSRVMRDTLA